jgi:DNA polymerase
LRDLDAEGEVLMPAVIREVADFAGWRNAARDMALRGVPPDEVVWTAPGAAQGALFEPARAPDAPAAGRLTVPRAFLEAAAKAALHSDPGRWDLLYRILWRLLHGEPHLLDICVDDHVRALASMERAVE